MIQDPKISVIMPVYNAEKFLQESLDGLTRQTLHDFEIICVDDGSTDQSPAILREYAQKDERFVLLSQEHGYAGAARNLGISHARGKYLVFLDADDHFKPGLLQAAWDQAEKTGAEICVFPADKFDHQTGIVIPWPLTCDKSRYPQEVFSKEDDPDGIFSFTNPGPCKLFLRSFILDNSLTFPTTKSQEDLPFVMTAIAIASRITALDKVLLQYRVNNNTSLTGAQEKNLLTFYDSLLELKNRLQARGLYEQLERAFVNLAAVIVFYNLHAPATSSSFRTIYDFVKDTVLDKLTLSNREDDYFFVYPEMQFPERIRVIREEDIFSYMVKFREVPRDLQMAAAESISGWDLVKLLKSRVRTKLRREKTLF